MQTTTLTFFFLSLYMIKGQMLDNLHCRLATCHEFSQGLKRTIRAQEYANICYETVAALQTIPRKYGKCIDELTGRLNPWCIQALATTIKGCIRQLSDLNDKTARYYCGYTLMKYCAISVGLERYPLNHQSYPTDIY